MNDPTISMTGLVRDFGSKHAVDGVSLKLDAGQILALAGPNGAGKTTLLKLLAGLIAPTRGSAEILGEYCFPSSPKIVGRIGCILDGLEPPRRCRIRDVFRLKSAAVREFDSLKAESLCRDRGIGMHQRWHSLSKGQKHWVLAVAVLSGNADVLLLDEPADGLDPSARQQLYGLLRDDANERGTSVIVASHILANLEQVADEVAVIDSGQIKLHAELEELRDEVREIEINGDAIPLDDLPAGATLLGTRSSDPVHIGWIRFADPSDAARSLPGEIRRRSVGLERVYLAITDHAWQPEQSHVEEPADVPVKHS